MSTIVTGLPAPAIQALTTFSFAALLPDQPRILRSRSVMLALSYLIEDTAAASPNTSLIATFQRFSHYHRQLHRYRRLAPRLAQAFVLGFPDVPPAPLPGVTPIALAANWPLVHEWVVIALGPACAVALVACDEERRAPHGVSRSFHAVWTTNERLVERMAAAFFAAIGQPAPVVTAEPTARQQTALALQRELPQRLRAIKR